MATNAVDRLFPINVMHDSVRLDPLAWIHRREARSLTKELRRAGYAVQALRWTKERAAESIPGPLLLRLADPMMLSAAGALTRAQRSYCGPSLAVLERCYDKYAAYRLATAHGLDCPETALAGQSREMRPPLVVKPRQGSDSLGLRMIHAGPIPTRLRTDRYIVQRQIRGAELTVAIFGDRPGMPLRIFLPEGVSYSFLRKYLLRPRQAPVTDGNLSERVRRLASEIGRIFGINWAARIDLIHESATDRLCFLECDVAPLVGDGSAFAASFTAAGVPREEQLRMLVNPPIHSFSSAKNLAALSYAISLELSS